MHCSKVNGKPNGKPNALHTVHVHIVTNELVVAFEHGTSSRSFPVTMYKQWLVVVRVWYIQE